MIGTKINTGKIGSRIRVRIMRPWRGYPVGAVIAPPGAMRQILLQAKDPLGNKIAEEVAETALEAAAPVTGMAGGPSEVETHDDVGEAPVNEENESSTDHKPKRSRKK